MKLCEDKDFFLAELEDEVEAQAAEFFDDEVEQEITDYHIENGLVKTNENSVNKPVIESFLSQLPTTRRKLTELMISHATYDKFPRHAEFIDSEGLEKNGMHGFYNLSQRVGFYCKYKELFKACIEEEVENLYYLSVLDWYIRLDYPSYQVGTTEGFELTNELITKVFIDLDTTNTEHDGMVDALVRELLLETAKSFMQFINK